MSEPELKYVVEAALLAAGRPLTVDQLQGLFEEPERPDAHAVRQAIEALKEDYAPRGVEIVEVASGFRLQVRKEYSPWVSRLWEERPPRFSRALLETLAIVAYRQPITRGEIEEIRGVSVSTGIMRTLQDRGWVRGVGQRDVPGRPTLYGTTKAFLDYFNLRSLDELPSLMELKDLDRVGELGLEDPDAASAPSDRSDGSDDAGTGEADEGSPEAAASDADDRAGPAEDEGDEARSGDEAAESEAEAIDVGDETEADGGPVKGTGSALH